MAVAVRSGAGVEVILVNIVAPGNRPCLLVKSTCMVPIAPTSSEVDVGNSPVSASLMVMDG